MDVRKLNMLSKLSKRGGRMARGVGPVVMLGVLLVLFCLAGLGSLRFRVANLASRLEDINANITHYANEEARLKQELSAVIAPIKIYTYCKERLGMQKVLKAETLPVFTRQGQQVAQNSEQKSGWFASLAATFGRETDTPRGVDAD